MPSRPLPPIPVESWAADQIDLFKRQTEGYFPALEFEAVTNDQNTQIPADWPYPGGKDQWQQAADQAAEEERQRQQRLLEQQQQQAALAEQQRQAALQDQAVQMASSLGIPTPSDAFSTFQNAQGQPPGTGDNTSTAGVFEPGTQPLGYQPPASAPRPLPMEPEPLPGPTPRDVGPYPPYGAVAGQIDRTPNLVPYNEQTGETQEAGRFQPMQSVEDFNNYANSTQQQIGVQPTSFEPRYSEAATARGNTIGNAASALWNSIPSPSEIPDRLADIGRSAGQATVEEARALPGQLRDIGESAGRNTGQVVRGIGQLALGDNAFTELQAGGQGIGKYVLSPLEAGAEAVPGAIQHEIERENKPPENFTEQTLQTMEQGTPGLRGATAVGSISQEVTGAMGDRFSDELGVTGATVTNPVTGKPLINPVTGEGVSGRDLIRLGAQTFLDPLNLVGGGAAEHALSESRRGLSLAERLALKGPEVGRELVDAGGTIADDPLRIARLPSATWDLAKETAADFTHPEARGRVGSVVSGGLDRVGEGVRSLAESDVARRADLLAGRALDTGVAAGRYAFGGARQYIEDNPGVATKVAGSAIGAALAPDDATPQERMAYGLAGGGVLAGIRASKFPRTGSVVEGFRRMAHGSPVVWDLIDRARFDADGLYGPAHYLTSDPRVASEYALGIGPGGARRTQDITGANIRPTDLDDRAYFYHADRIVPPKEVEDIGRAALRLHGDDPELARIAQEYIVAGQNKERSGGHALYESLAADFGPTPESMIGWDDATGITTGGKGVANQILSEAGFDGVYYKGGRRTGTYDDAGRLIEHDAVAIFPDKLDSIRGAWTREPRSQLPGEELSTRVPRRVERETLAGATPRAAGLMGNVAGSTVGAVTGAISGDEDTTWDQRLKQALVGATIGGQIGGHLGTQSVVGAARLMDSLIKRGAVDLQALMSHPRAATRIQTMLTLAAEGLPDNAAVEVPGNASWLYRWSKDPSAAALNPTIRDGIENNTLTAGQIRTWAQSIPPASMKQNIAELVTDALTQIPRRARRTAETAADTVSVRGLPAEQRDMLDFRPRFEGDSLGYGQDHRLYDERMLGDNPDLQDAFATAQAAAESAAQKLGVETPRVMIRPVGNVNAAVYSPPDHQPIIGVTKGLLDQIADPAGMTPRELEGMFMHEFGHVGDSTAAAQPSRIMQATEDLPNPQMGEWRDRLDRGLEIPKTATPAERERLTSTFNRAMDQYAKIQTTKRATLRMRWGSDAERYWKIYEDHRDRVFARRGETIKPDTAPRTTEPVPAVREETGAGIPGETAPGETPEYSPTVEEQYAVASRKYDEKLRLEDEIAQAQDDLQAATTPDEQLTHRATLEDLQAQLDDLGETPHPSDLRRTLSETPPETPSRLPVASEDIPFEEEGLPTTLDPARVFTNDEAGKLVRSLRDTLALDKPTQDWMNAQAVNLLSLPKITGRNVQKLLTAVGERRAPPRGDPAEYAQQFVERTLQDNGIIAKPGSETVFSNLGPASGIDPLGVASNVLQMGVTGGMGAAANQQLNPDDPNAALEGFLVGAFAPTTASAIARGALRTAGREIPEAEGALGVFGPVFTSRRGGKLAQELRNDPTLQANPQVQMFVSPTRNTQMSGLGLYERAHDYWRNVVVHNWTDRIAALQGWQNDVAKIFKQQTGGDIPADVMAAELARFNSNKAVQMDVNDYYRPHLKTFERLDIPQEQTENYLLNKQNIDIAMNQGKTQQVPPGSGVSMFVPNLKRDFPGGQTFGGAVQWNKDFEAALQKKLTPAQYTEYQGAIQGVHDFGDRVLKYAVEGGLIDQKTYTELRQAYPHYVPTRIVDYLLDESAVAHGKSLSVNSNTLKELTQAGTTKEAMAPTAALLGQAYQVHEAAQKNQVANALVNLWEMSTGQTPMMGFTPPSTASGNLLSPEEARVARYAQGMQPWPTSGAVTKDQQALTLFRNGVKQKYAVSKELGDIVTYSSPGSIPLLSGLTAAFRAAATSRNPAFLAANTLLDLSSLLVRETVRESEAHKLGPLTAVWPVLHEWGKAMKEFANPLNPQIWRDIANNTYRGDMAEALREGGGMSGGHYAGSGVRPPEWGNLKAGPLTMDLSSMQNRLGLGQTSELEGEIRKLQRGAIEVNSPAELATRIKDILLFKPVEQYGERLELAGRLPAYRLARNRTTAKIAPLRDELTFAQSIEKQTLQQGGNQRDVSQALATAGIRDPQVLQNLIAEEGGRGNIQRVQNFRTTTLDFDKGGVMAKAINRFVPFFNVGMQSGADVFRAIQDNPAAWAGTVAGVVVAPTVMAEMWNQSDPQMAKDYRDVPSYQKDRGIIWMLPETIGKALPAAVSGALPKAVADAPLWPAPTDTKGNRYPQYFLFPFRQLAPISMATRELLQQTIYHDRITDDERRSILDLGLSALSQVAPVNVGSAQDLALLPLPVGASTAAQLLFDRDVFRGNRRIASKYADERASPLSHALSAGAGAVLDPVGLGDWAGRPSQWEFGTRDVGAGYAGALHGISSAIGGDPTTISSSSGVPSVLNQSTPVAGGLYGKWIRGSIGEGAQQAETNTITPSAASILRQNGVDWRPSPASPEIRGFPLTRIEYGVMQKNINRATDIAIHDMASDPRWQRLSETRKKEVMQAYVSRRRQLEERKFIQTIPDAEFTRRLRAARLAAAGR